MILTYQCVNAVYVLICLFSGLFICSDERDVDDPLMDKDEIQVIASQSLTIVDDDASLGSSEDHAAVAGLAHSMLDGDDDVQYFRSGDGGKYCPLSILFNIHLF